MARARAEWRAKRARKTSNSLWGFENWVNEGTEGHHVACKKYGDQLIDVPISMHQELTRRQMEEHPPEGPDPDNPVERQGRVHLGLRDLHAGLADGHGLIAERMIQAARRGERDLKAVHIPEGLLGWLSRIAHDVAQVTRRGLRKPDKE